MHPGPSRSQCWPAPGPVSQPGLEGSQPAASCATQFPDLRGSHGTCCKAGGLKEACAGHGAGTLRTTRSAVALGGGWLCSAGRTIPPFLRPTQTSRSLWPWHLWVLSGAGSSPTSTLTQWAYLCAWACVHQCVGARVPVEIGTCARGAWRACARCARVSARVRGQHLHFLDMQKTLHVTCPSARHGPWASGGPGSCWLCVCSEAVPDCPMVQGGPEPRPLGWGSLMEHGVGLRAQNSELGAEGPERTPTLPGASRLAWAAA